MRIAALNPPFLPRYSRGQRSPAVTRSGTLYFPIWLSYAVGYLEKLGHEVLFVDAPAAGLDAGQTLAMVRDFGPGLAVVETSTPSIQSDVDFADRMALDGIPVLLVGTHPSALPAETVGLGRAFAGVVTGEYELPLSGAAEALACGRPLDGVPGLALRAADGCVITGPAGRIENLDILPFVSQVYARHLDVADYDNPNALHPQVMILGGRGCPNYCTFCLFPQTLSGRKTRLRSTGNIVEEMLWVKENLPSVRAVFFEDDTLSADVPRLRELASAILEAGAGMSWTANMRANVDFETLAICRKAGLRSVCTGFESGNQGILDSMKKGVSLEDMRRFAADARRAGVLVHGCFLFGTQGETTATMRQTLDFALELDPDTAQFYPLMVYPGTEAYRQAEKEGFLTAGCWRDWLGPEGLHNCVVRTADLTPSQIVEFCDEARRRFYLRPAYILRKLFRGLRDPEEWRRTSRAFRTFRRYLLPSSSRRGCDR
jgi:radical SAM superfamily enzyme YgiQ (UPF0313 family)